MTFGETLRRILTNWRLLLFVIVVVVLTSIGEAKYGENAGLVGLAVGMSVGSWLARRWL